MTESCDHSPDVRTYAGSLIDVQALIYRDPSVSVSIRSLNPACAACAFSTIFLLLLEGGPGVVDACAAVGARAIARLHQGDGQPVDGPSLDLDGVVEAEIAGDDA